MPTIKIPHLNVKDIITKHVHVFDLPWDLSWDTMASTNQPLPFCQAFIVKGQIWVIGGAQKMEIYHSATNTWSIKNGPLGRTNDACFVATNDGKIFGFGLWSETYKQYNKVVQYDPMTDTLTTKAYMPQQSILGGAVVAQNNRIYVIGGYVQQTDQAIATVQEYDVQTNTWTVKQAMPVARYATGMVAVKEEIFVTGGFSNDREELTTVQVYNTVSNTWQDLKPLNIKRRFSPTVAGKNGKLYAIGGLCGCASINIVEEYDRKTNKWTPKAPMPTARWGFGAVVLGDKIYTIGGLMRTGSYQPGNPNVSYLNTVEAATIPII